MKEFLFKDINVVLADSDHSYRHTIFNMLRNIGLRKIRQAASLEEIKGVMAEPAADILICEADLSDGNFSDFVYAVRNGDIGKNPFVAMLTVTAEPTKELVRMVIDSGSDDLLTKPLSATQMKDRIVHLIEKRKPFVVTSDYIGPTRREGNPRGTPIPLVDVPNTLREKATGIREDRHSQEKIDTAIRQINLQKLKRHADQIVYLVDHIIAAIAAAENDEKTQGHIKRLDFVAQDTGRRLANTDLEHITNLCQTLTEVSKRIRTNLNSPKQKDLDLLPPLAAAIKAAFQKDTEDTASIADQISSELSNEDI